jgi:predicted transposase YbfD/YdcC
MGDKISIERRYFLCSLAPDAKVFAQAVRGHWGVENRLHWSLDVTFKEDACRATGNAAQNFATLRHIALNLLKSEPSKRSIRRKRLTAGWDNEFLGNILERQIL